ncbi:hypothetical protein EUTSA_v10008706mg [Eutrema salsugineum]|uniref:Dehydrin n=1 Tax=Eutrema salsugineum TaxID=72664 RepID=V4KAP5_EUTSA|nr:dehydrin COR47 [Eutrema salsugineum]ESQ34755.1 hypothetical protein EUTSA_v10008706mg [Eutrema salsugineum]
MAEEYKNSVPEHETPEVKDRGVFDFLGQKKEEVKPQETTTKVDDEAMENKHTLLEELQEKTEEDKQNKPSVIEKLHGSNSSSSSSDEEGEKKKKTYEGEEEKKGVMENIKEKLPGHGNKAEDHDVPVVTTMPATHSSDHVVEHHQTEEEKKGMTEKIKEKLPGHSKKPEDSQVVNTTPMVETATPITAEHTAEKKGILEKIKEKLPGQQAKTNGEEEMKEKEAV